MPTWVISVPGRSALHGLPWSFRFSFLTLRGPLLALPFHAGFLLGGHCCFLRCVRCGGGFFLGKARLREFFFRRYRFFPRQSLKDCLRRICASYFGGPRLRHHAHLASRS